MGPEDIRLEPRTSGLAHAADNNSEGIRVCSSPIPTLTHHPGKENGTRRFLGITVKTVARGWVSKWLSTDLGMYPNSFNFEFSQKLTFIKTLVATTEMKTGLFLE